MPSKKGAKPIWVAQEIHAKLEEYLRGLGWEWGKTKYVERLIDLECAGELYRLDEKDAKRRQVGEKFLFGKAGLTSVEAGLAELEKRHQSEK